MTTNATTRGPRWNDRFLLWLAETTAFDGLDLVTTYGETERVLPRLQEALLLIKNHDPNRYERLKRDLSRIWVRILRGPLASFNASMRACQLDPRFVLDPAVTTGEIAATIAHEGTHARIGRCGIPYSETLRERIETMCRRQEIALADRLPEGAVVRIRAERAIAAALDWSNAAMAGREEHGTVEALRYLTPKWLFPVSLALRSAIGTIRRLASRLTSV